MAVVPLTLKTIALVARSREIIGALRLLWAMVTFAPMGPKQVSMGVHAPQIFPRHSKRLMDCGQA